MDQQIPITAETIIGILERKLASATKEANFWEASCVELNKVLQALQTEHEPELKESEVQP